MENKLEKIVALAKRRGFIFPGSEIYGGISGIYDYGPLGVEFKNNVKQAWRKEMFRRQDNIFELDSSILMQRQVWEASGHTSAGFTDPLRECKKCHHRYRADHLAEEGIDKCPNCGGELMEARKFNLLVETHLGPVKDDSSLTYLRGETTQGIYVNYKNIKTSMSAEIPFGVGQIGKAFRNEITPGHFTYRMREFEQMEQQYFVKPAQAEKYFEYWKNERMKWYLGLGVKKEKLRFRPHAKDELAHYAKGAEDIEYEFPFGWHEIEGVHNRGDWDLSRHSKFSGEDLSEVDEKTGERFYPYIVETSAGADRAALVFLIDAYSEDKNNERIVLKLHPKLASYKAAVFPLLRNKPELVNKAREVYLMLKKQNLGPVAWDDRGNIGKRYYSQDEIGTPWTITCDFQTLEDDTITVRDRDTTKQERVKIQELKNYFEDKLK
ncbi:MAG: glycine--tRNA ligase [Parcubacteria group bacterium RIFCSPLOWO2_01_FULL_40_65]|nr:MAG: glycine--tRNA ligase [Parcubacteria group bacterium RIFCSPHIGHO2_01_FULL_40_30]OHB19441.1 MAG: glycine--tRNA ligase [Parcubacteria group bacterium RIFCSPHIGHO2_02_FULL_40_12]OHB21608.1 MAG: glycine--tRNA ligase [Parcubacteria group bacterium RIFCSPLOWO2_01_FULL_40_65]OHB23470.1 MAG: glycine--tRNA ligase [Parcubacteria group bacterium RIFCSPLOWO2_02_FULL_40_12]